jgi:hypothetical protein
MIINKLSPFLGPNKLLEASFWGQKVVSKDKHVKKILFIFLKGCFGPQNGAFKPIFGGII